MQLTRDGQTDYELTNISLYGQDTITHGRATLQLGVRYDCNHDQALASSVAANPLRAGHACRPSASPAPIRASKFNNFSPRLGFTYDIDGDGKTIARANYARTAARSAPAASPARSTRSRRVSSAIRGSTRTATSSSRRTRSSSRAATSPTTWR